jgi:tetratricopeptide (TPR) repeat protein
VEQQEFSRTESKIYHALLCCNTIEGLQKQTGLSKSTIIKKINSMEKNKMILSVCLDGKQVPLPLTHVKNFKAFYADAYDSRGCAYQYAGNFSIAITDYEKALSINPGISEAKNVWMKNTAGKVKTADFTKVIEECIQDSRFMSIVEWTELMKRHAGDSFLQGQKLETKSRKQVAEGMYG